MSNLQDLLLKLQALEEAQSTQASDLEGGAGAADESVEECGDMGSPSMGGEVDECGGGAGNVELSMNDLVKLVKALQGGDSKGLDGDHVLIGDEYANEPGEEVAPVSAVTVTGDDLASQGDESPKANGGGNPMQAHLAELYSQIKEAAKKSDIPAVQRKAKGGDWKVTKQELDAEEKEGKISHKDNLAKATGSLKEANEIARRLRKV